MFWFLTIACMLWDTLDHFSDNNSLSALSHPWHLASLPCSCIPIRECYHMKHIKAHAMECGSTAAISWRCDNMRCIKKTGKQKQQMCLERCDGDASRASRRAGGARLSLQQPLMTRHVAPIEALGGACDWAGRKSRWQLDRDPTTAQGVKSHTEHSSGPWLLFYQL